MLGNMETLMEIQFSNGQMFPWNIKEILQNTERKSKSFDFMETSIKCLWLSIPKEESAKKFSKTYSKCLRLSTYVARKSKNLFCNVLIKINFNYLCSSIPKGNLFFSSICFLAP